MIKELDKQEVIHIWNNHYQGTFAPSAFDELLKTNDIINHELWGRDIAEIKKAINDDFFESFVRLYQSHKLNQEVEDLETFAKEGSVYFVLNLCVNLKDVQFKACFLLDEDYTVQYLCIDSKIEISTLDYKQLNIVYNRYKQLIPPPLEFIKEFNLMNTALSKITGKDVDRTMYQAWFKLVPNIKLDRGFVKAYNTYQRVGDDLFGETKEKDSGNSFEYL